MNVAGKRKGFNIQAPKQRIARMRNQQIMENVEANQNLIALMLESGNHNRHLNPC